ncbi:MAG: hypothetical protein SWE60_07405 [Thermodesulfobacteriota bacterium]|nr:hypothetical protein [Thermodesulfobacteriota bacterium]
MRGKPLIVLVSVGCFVLFMGCAGKNTVEVEKKLMTMSDSELILHYDMIEMRMVDIDRAKQEAIEQRRDMDGSYSQKQYNHLEHLHIGDYWNKLKKEKELTLIEMRKRGISPP